MRTPQASDTRRRIIAIAIPFVLVSAAGALLFLRLDEPPRIYFDETYYVDDARDYLDKGSEAGFAVHPPVGKWLIATGIKLFGDEPFGWRATGAAAGMVVVLLVYLMSLRLFRARGPAAVAAMLTMTDGLFFSQARIAMLDIYLVLFVTLGAWLLLLEYSLRRDATGKHERSAGVAGSRWIRHLAGLSFGLAIATKWSGLLALGAAVVLAVGWEIWLRMRAAGIGMRGLAWWSPIPIIWLVAAPFVIWTWSLAIGLGIAAAAWIGLEFAIRRSMRGTSVRRPGYPLLGVTLSFLVIPAVVYLASWTPWLANFKDTYTAGRSCPIEVADDEPCDASLAQRLQALGKYHDAILGFHRRLEAKHSYRAKAHTWPVMARPVVYYWETCEGDRADGIPKTEDDGTVVPAKPCVVDTTQAAEIFNLGNPTLWYGFLGALLLLAGGLVRADWRAVFILAFWGAQYIPWLVVSRPLFFFYMVPNVAFMALGLAYMSVVLGEGRAMRWMLMGAGAGAAAGVAIGVGLEMFASADATFSWASAPKWIALACGAIVGAGLGTIKDMPHDAVAAGATRSPLLWVGRRVGARLHRRTAWVGAGLAIAAVGFFVFFYPVWSGLPLPRNTLRARWWLDGWI